MEFQYSTQGQVQQQQPIGNLPSSTANEKTLLWSQPQQYMIDSGYTTQAPSISSVDAFLNEEQQLEAAAAAVVAAAPQQAQQPYMAPPPPPRPDWNVEQQQQQNGGDMGIENWVQDDSEALRAVPELIKLINDEDSLVVSQAAAVVYQVSRKKACCLAFIETPDFLTSLCNCLANDSNIETPKNILGTFYNMSLHKQAIPKMINAANVLPALVHFLSVPIESIVSFSITTLHNILLAYNDIKVQLRKYGAIKNMVPLLRRHTNPKFLAIVVDCLQQLAFGNQESKLAILELGGPEMLVEILKTSTYPKLILQTTRLLKVLSVCAQNKKALISYGVMQALALHLTSQSTNELQNCLITLRNLSDAATRMPGLEGLIEMLMKLMQMQQPADDQICLLAAGILSNLTCNNESNKTLVMRLDGVNMLIRVIHQSCHKPDLIEPCLCILRHITNRHKDAAIAQEQLRAANGLDLILNLLTMQPRKWLVLKATLGLLRNFASSQVNLPLLRNQMLLQNLMQITFEAFNELQRGVQVVEEVKLMDILDVLLNILAMVTKDFQCQLILRDINSIGFITSLFYAQMPKVATLAGAVLVDFVQNKECIELVEQQPNIFMYLSKLASCPPTPEVSQLITYAKMIMQFIQEHKNAKQQRMLQQQQMNQQQQFQQGWPQQQQPQPQYDMYGGGQENVMYNQQYGGAQQQQMYQPPMMPPQQQVFQQQPQQNGYDNAGSLTIL